MQYCFKPSNSWYLAIASVKVSRSCLHSAVRIAVCACVVCKFIACRLIFTAGLSILLFYCVNTSLVIRQQQAEVREQVLVSHLNKSLRFVLMLLRVICCSAASFFLLELFSEFLYLQLVRVI